MFRFAFFKKIIYISFCISTLSLFSDGLFGADVDDQRLSTMLCPITLEIMRDPVLTADGYTYERSAIEEWFRRSGGINPMTGEPLTSQNLIPNKALREMIRVRMSETQAASPSLNHLMERPQLAQGNEAIYDLFMSGHLVYKPHPDSDVGKIVMPFSEIIDPNTLEGEFDLRRFGNIAVNVCIRLGDMEYHNDDPRITINIVPKFVARGRNSSFNSVFWHSESDVGIFWRNKQVGFTYLWHATTTTIEQISEQNLDGLLRRRAVCLGHPNDSPPYYEFLSLLSIKFGSV